MSFIITSFALAPFPTHITDEAAVRLQGTRLASREVPVVSTHGSVMVRVPVPERYANICRVKPKASGIRYNQGGKSTPRDRTVRSQGICGGLR